MTHEERIEYLEATVAKQTIAIEKLCEITGRLETAAKASLAAIEALAGLEAERGGGAKSRANDLN